MRENNAPEWEKEFKRIIHNPIYFIEYYWNQSHTEAPVCLSKEEKQQYYDKYKGTPFFEDMRDAFKYMENRDKIKAEGYEDWQIFDQ